MFITLLSHCLPFVQPARMTDRPSSPQNFSSAEHTNSPDTSNNAEAPEPSHTAATDMRPYELEHQARLEAYYRSTPSDSSAYDSLFNPPGGGTTTTRRRRHLRKGFDAQPVPPPGAFVDRDDKQYALDAPNIPRPSLRDVPVECELCHLHAQEGMKDRTWIHVHSLEFRDCFTLGPAPGGSWRSIATCKATRRAARRQWGHSPKRGLILPKPRTTLFPPRVLKRQKALAGIVLKAVEDAVEDERKGEEMPWWRRRIEAYPPGQVQKPHPSKPGSRCEPIWTGRACQECSLADDFGSFVHVHMPERGICFTFGERGSHALVRKGPSEFPLSEEEREEGVGKEPEIERANELERQEEVKEERVEEVVGGMMGDMGRVEGELVKELAQEQE